MLLRYRHAMLTWSRLSYECLQQNKAVLISERGSNMVPARFTQRVVLAKVLIFSDTVVLFVFGWHFTKALKCSMKTRMAAGHPQAHFVIL